MSARKRSQSAETKTVESKSTQNPHLYGINMAIAEEPMFFYQEDCSDLTHGQVMCGNPVHALRQRNKQKKNPRAFKKQIITSSSIFTPERSYMSSEENNGTKGNILEELRQWRLQNTSLFGEDHQFSVSLQKTIKEDRSSASPLPSPSFSPTPPLKPRGNKTSPRIFQSLPSPPVLPHDEHRPHTAADFRSRRFRLASPDLDYRDKPSKTLRSINESDIDLNSNISQMYNNITPSRRPATRAAIQHVHTTEEDES